MARRRWSAPPWRLPGACEHTVECQVRAVRQGRTCPRDARQEPRPLRVEVTFMTQDLAALAPSAIVCIAFLIGAWMLLRRELAPKRRARAKADPGTGDEPDSERGDPSET